jgi:hypothetical protein
MFHDKRHPLELGAGEVTAFLSHLAVKRNVAASTQNLEQPPKRPDRIVSKLARSYDSCPDTCLCLVPRLRF